jgi:hypothetical protein
MSEIRDYVAGNECVEMAPAQLEKMRAPGVYLYLSDDGSTIYVGSSYNMLWRAAREDHEHAKARSASKSILFIPCKTLNDARALEQKLILELRPALNKRGGMRLLAHRLGLSSQAQVLKYKHT